MRTLRLKTSLAVSVFFFCLYFFVTTAPALADIQYVSDLLIISIREGQDPDAPVLGYLRSAAAVDVLEETEELMLIRTEDGTQGWVRKKFIVADKPKAVIIGELEEKVALLEAEIKTLQDGSDAQGFNQSESDTEGLKKIIQGYKQEILTLSASLQDEKKTALAQQQELKQINVKYQQLLNKSKENNGISKELASLKDENKRLKDKITAQTTNTPPPLLTGNMKWFLIGCGVLVLGFLIGRSIRTNRPYRL